MQIQDVEKLAELSRLDMTHGEKEAILKDMDGILAYIKTIEGVKVEDIQPANELHNVWREDAPEPRAFSHDLIVEQFPDAQDGFLKVKKIL